MSYLTSTALVPAWTLGDRLRKAREAAGLSQGDLSTAIDVSRRAISNYELGNYQPKRPVILSWAMCCGVDVAWLRDGITPANSPDDPTALTASGAGEQAKPSTIWTTLEARRLHPMSEAA